MRRWRLCLAALALPLTACAVPGELGNLGFDLGTVDPLIEFESGDRVLLGSRICPGVAEAAVDNGTEVFLGTQQDDVRACFDESIVGPAQLDADGCLPFDAPGEVTWSLTPTGTCEYEGDQLRFTIVNPDPELRLGFDDWRARAPERIGTDAVMVVGLAPGRSLADFREDPSAPRLVIANALDVPLMRLDDSGGRIYWSLSDVSLALVGEDVTAVEPHEDFEEGFFEYQSPGELPLRMELDGVARVRATLPDGQVLESPELIGVSSVAAASLDLVAVVETETGSPAYAFAELRDAQGRVLHGAVVEWSMEAGALSVTSGYLDNEVRTGEYAMLETGCEPPSATTIQHSAVLRARYGALEDTVELVWTEEAASPETLESPFTPDESCLFADDSGENGETGGDELGADLHEGCGCTGGDRKAPGAWLLALIGLGLLRRRR